MVLDMSARLHAPMPVRFACLCHDLGKGTTPTNVLPRHIGHEGRSVKLLQALCERWRVPKDCKELAEVVAREHGHIHQSLAFGAEAIWRLLERCDALRRPQRFADVLLACECDARGRLGHDDDTYPQAARLSAALEAALAVETAPIAAQVMAHAADASKAGPHIAQAIGTARTAAVDRALKAFDASSTGASQG
jgi:tRNA nucleotidyltransferase (CCA-adding enzyme)